MKASLVCTWLLILFVLGAAAHGGDSETMYGIHCILPGDNADPSILRVGDDFYMTHSSFHQVPGLTIWHSRDLLNWERVARALNRHVGSVWAPDLVEHDGTYYIYFPAGGSNWVVSAPAPEGPWSDPVDLGIGLIDPGHAAGEDGRRYLHMSDGQLYDLAEDGLSVVGPPRKVYEGWAYPADWVVEGFCLEAPKICRRGDWYYLTTAEGGTAGPSTSHMVVSARSRTPEGPWENSPYNPIVRTWDKSEQWWSKGHGTIFDDAEGNWYVVYHAYRNGHYPLGRHTLIEPIRWTDDGWFQTVRPAHEEGRSVTIDNGAPVSDSFEDDAPHLQWQFLGIETPDEVRMEDGSLVLPATQDRMRMMALTTTKDSFDARIAFETEGDVEVGLLVYYSDDANAGIFVHGDEVSGLRGGHRNIISMDTGSQVKHLGLRLDRYDLSTSYSADGETWIPNPASAEVSTYTHTAFGGFYSLKLAIGCRGTGTLRVKWFDFAPVTR